MNLTRAQDRAERLMTDSCTITRITGVTTDPTTGAVSETTSTVYSGKCRVQSWQPFEQTPDVGSATPTVQRYQVHIPVGVAVRIGDQVTMADGRLFRIAATHTKTYQTAQRLPVDELTS